MKKTTKALALALCAVLLVVGTALTTVAYLTSKDNVVNTFTVGKVNIKLDEADVDEYGQQLYKEAEEGENPEKADRVKTNEYKLVPACTYTKDPMVTVLADSEECYVRMIVTIKDLADVKNAFGTVSVNGNDYFLPQNFVQGWDSTKWVSTNVIKEENNTATYEFRYYTTVSTVDGPEKALEPLFTSFKVPEDVTEEKIELLEDFEIQVVAHAIQEAGFDNADAAWAAFVEPTTNN